VPELSFLAPVITTARFAMPIICKTCGAYAVHISSACPLQHRERDMNDAEYVTWLENVRKHSLLPVLDSLIENYGNKDCQDEVVPDAVAQLFINGRVHGPWDVPHSEHVQVYLRGKPGNVFFHMDYSASRLVAGSMRSDIHCQKQRFKLDVNVKNSFFSSTSCHQRKVELFKNAIEHMPEWHAFMGNPDAVATITLDELAGRVVDALPDVRNPLNAQSNPMKSRFFVKTQVADFVRSQLNYVGDEPHGDPVPLACEGDLAVVLRLKRDCSRNVLLNSTFGRECKEKGVHMEPHWANGALVFVDIANPWSLPPGIKFERYHVLVGEQDVERFDATLKEAIPSHNKRPRYETVHTFALVREALTETMQGYADMLHKGYQLDAELFTKLIHMCCKSGGRLGYQNAYTLLREMDLKQIPPTEVTFNCILSAFHRGCGKKAEKIMVRMKDKHGLVPTQLAYNIVIKAYKKQRDSKKAELWQREAASQYPGSFGSKA
jgi:hypothetical protein